MEVLGTVNWIALFALILTLLMFKVLNWLVWKINWTFVVLLSLLMGSVMGVVFASEDNSNLIWLNLIGDGYIQIIKALVAPVVLVSVISGFITLNDKDKMKKIGVQSVTWLLLSTAAAIGMSIFFGLITGLGKSAGAVFSEIKNVEESAITAYGEMGTSVDKTLLALLPRNMVGDLGADNIVAIIIIAIAVAAAYVNVASDEGEETVVAFKNLIESGKKIIFRILAYVIDLTPYAVLCLSASSASRLFRDKQTFVQLLLLVGMIYVVGLLHTYGFNAIILKYCAKVSPLKFFQKTFDTQVTAFTTQSSVGSLPITIDRLTRKIGVDEEVANFTAPLGTTIGMPGCTCIWPILLAIFYVNATGVKWGLGEYMVLAVMSFVLSFGSAGVPGIGVVSAVSLFSAVNLPVAAVVLLIPINNISDMVRTLTNVMTANVSAAIVARRTGLLDDEIFDADE